MTVELQSLHPAGRPADPGADADHQRRRDAARHATEPDRVYVVTGHYDSRVTDVLERHRRRARRRRRRLRRRRRARAGARDGDPPADATIVFVAVAGEEQGLYGSTYLAEQAQGRGHRRPGHVQQRHRRQQRRRRRHARPAHGPAVRRGRPDRRRRREQAALRQSVGGENDGPSRQLARFVKEVAENRATGMNVRLDLAARPLPARRRPHPVPRSRATRRRGSPSRARTSTTSTRTSGSRTACSSATCPSSSTSATSPGSPGSTAPRSGRSRSAPGHAAGRRRSTRRSLTNDTDAALGRATPSPTSPATRSSGARPPTPDWTHAIAGRQRHRATLDLSKDNVQFGVRAVDRDGNRSPAAFPLPSD